MTRSWGPWARFDADVAWSRARYTDAAPAGDRIPGAVEGVVSAEAAVPEWRGFFGSARFRVVRPRPLIEDNSVRSRSSATLNVVIGRSLARWGRLSLEGFNVLDAKVSDVDYYYASRLPGEAAGGVNDIHTHPQAPRTIRLRFSATWPGPEDLTAQAGQARMADENH